MTLKPMSNWTREDFVAANAEADKAVRDASTINIGKSEMWSIDPTILAEQLSKGFGELAARDRHSAGKGRKDVSEQSLEGLTVWLTPDRAGRVGLVRNADGTTAVSIDARTSFHVDPTGTFSELIRHLGIVADLGYALTVWSPEAGARRARVISNDERDERTDQDGDVSGHCDNLGLTAPACLGDRSDVVVTEDDVFSSVGELVTHNSSPSVDGTSTATVGDGQVVGVERTAPATAAIPPSRLTLLENLEDAETDLGSAAVIRERAWLAASEADMNFVVAEAARGEAADALIAHINGGQA